MVANRPGVELMPLFRDEHEDVRLERWAPGSSVTLPLPGGAELLVLDGALSENGERLVPLSWLRLPGSSKLRAKAGPEGCTVWVTTGHLVHPQGVVQSRQRPAGSISTLSAFNVRHRS